MDSLDSQIVELWLLLNLHRVRYIIVGGFAINLHGYQRVTADLDIWIEDTLENRKQLWLVLFEMGLGDFTEIETTDFIPGLNSILLEDDFELDIMTYIDGYEAQHFDECYSSALTAIIEEIPVKFLHTKHLIVSKKKSGRTKDLLDIEELEKILNSRKF